MSDYDFSTKRAILTWLSNPDASWSSNPNISACCDPYGILYIFVPFLIPMLFAIPLAYSRTNNQLLLSFSLILLTTLLALGFFEWVSYWSWINRHTLEDGTMRRAWWEHWFLDAIMAGSMLFGVVMATGVGFVVGEVEREEKGWGDEKKGWGEEKKGWGEEKKGWDEKIAELKEKKKMLQEERAVLKRRGGTP